MTLIPDPLTETNERDRCCAHNIIANAVSGYDAQRAVRRDVVAERIATYRQQIEHATALPLVRALREALEALVVATAVFSVEHDRIAPDILAKFREHEKRCLELANAIEPPIRDYYLEAEADAQAEKTGHKA